jgi:hypothetical protein
VQRNDVTAAFYPNKLGGARARALLPLQLLSSVKGTRIPAAGASSWARPGAHAAVSGGPFPGPCPRSSACGRNRMQPQHVDAVEVSEALAQPLDRRGLG